MRIHLALFAGVCALARVFSTCTAAQAEPELNVAPSFDDGPHVTFTPKLLDILKAKGVTATFCLVGQRVRQWPEIVKRIYSEGHQLCNHSWSHPLLTAGNVGREIAKTDEAIAEAIGIKGFKAPILRAPGGNIHYIGNCYDGRPFVGWGSWDGKEYVGGDTLDWLHRSVRHIMRVAASAKPGEIVLMHDIHKTTIDSVPGIIEGLKARGMRFVHASVLWKHHCAPQVAGK